MRSFHVHRFGAPGCPENASASTLQTDARGYVLNHITIICTESTVAVPGMMLIAGKSHHDHRREKNLQQEKKHEHRTTNTRKASTRHGQDLNTVLQDEVMNKTCRYMYVCIYIYLMNKCGFSCKTTKFYIHICMSYISIHTCIHVRVRVYVPTYMSCSCSEEHDQFYAHGCASLQVEPSRPHER